MKKKIYLIIALVTFVPMFIVSAMTSKTGDNINQNEYIDGSAFFAGENVTIDSDINGDLFVFGSRVTINGNITGDIIGAAEKLIVNGDVQGNLRFAGQEIEVNKNIVKNVTVAGRIISIKEGAQIGNDVYAAGEQVIMDGNIIGRLEVASSSLNIKGKVGKSVSFYSEGKENAGITIAPEAVISGDIDYKAFGGDVQGVETGKNVLGSVNKTTPQVPEAPNATQTTISILGFLVSLVLVLYVIIFIGGINIKDIQKAMVDNPLKATGLGAILLIGLPIISIILIISGFGAFLGITGIVLFVFLILFSILFSVLSFGEIISRKAKPNISGRIYYTALVGILISFIIFKIPFLGFLMTVFFILWGAGGFLMQLLESRSDDIVIRKKEPVSLEKKEEIKTEEKESKDNTK